MNIIPEDIIKLLPQIHQVPKQSLRFLVDRLDDPDHKPSVTCPLYGESLYAMWCAEERMPVRLRRLYYRELLAPAYRFDESNGNCLGSDAYEWTLIHPRAEDRARAFVKTHALAKLCEIYDAGGEHEVLDQFREEFSTAAAEAGADRELDHDPEQWQEDRFAELFGPLREGYKP